MTIRLPIMLMCKNERKGVEDSDETTNVAQRLAQRKSGEAELGRLEQWWSGR